MKCTICGGDVETDKRGSIVKMTCKSCGAYGERKEPMVFVVYKFTDLSQDGNHGPVARERVKEFFLLEEAEEFVKDKKNDPGGWSYYTIVME